MLQCGHAGDRVENDPTWHVGDYLVVRLQCGHAGDRVENPSPRCPATPRRCGFNAATRVSGWGTSTLSSSRHVRSCFNAATRVTAWRTARQTAPAPCCKRLQCGHAGDRVENQNAAGDLMEARHASMRPRG